EMNIESVELFGGLGDGVCRLMVIAKFVCTMNCSNYMMSNIQKLTMCLLLEGEQWRAHQRQVFHYEDGAWVMVPSFTVRGWDLLLALEGLFVQLPTSLDDQELQVSWTWHDMKIYLMDIVGDMVETDLNVMQVLTEVAKSNSDHVRVKTGNKVWQARWTRRVADMLAQFRKALESENTTKGLTKLFLTEWDTTMPVSNGVCFRDVCLDKNWNVANKSAEANCYLKLDYHFFWENKMADHQNISIAEVGKGGDGKGMEAVLDRALFGDLATATLDCGMFLDRVEFRKSAELAWNKASIRIQEMESRGRFVADVWKRFVVDEEIDCRVNFGFTSKRRFGSAMKIQELNFENIPIIEESNDRTKSLEQLTRPVICFLMGKVTFTMDNSQVNHSRGIYKLIPQDELTNFLSNPVESYHCATTPPPGTVVDVIIEAETLVQKVHANTPQRRIFKEYLIHKVEVLPGCAASSKGKKPKLSNFVEALDLANSRLFNQVDSSCFHKLLIDWQRLVDAMEQHGGSAVIGTWADWTCPFQLLHEQEKWDGNAFENHCQTMLRHRTQTTEATLVRPIECRLLETINLNALEDYAAHETDRRQDLLCHYLQRHRAMGTKMGSSSLLQVEYYKLPHYGRLLSRGPSGQKLTKEARTVAFDLDSAEVDAACCYPRLLVRKLQMFELWDETRFPMLNLFVEHYASWREATAKYVDIPVADAKMELIRIFYGGKPSFEAPWILKLADEVQKAASCLLRHPEAAAWRDLYSDRRNPEFSRLSALLSFEENELLKEARDVIGNQSCVLLFDGAIIHCTSLEHEILVSESCRRCAQSIIPMSVKSWPTSTHSMTLARLALRRDMLSVVLDGNVITSFQNCLLNGIANVEFNEIICFASQQPSSESVHMILEPMTDVLTHVCSKEKWLCHQQMSDGTGHWFAVVFEESGEVRLVDSTAGARRLSIAADGLASLCCQLSGLTWFQLRNIPHSIPMDNNRAYMHEGTATGVHDDFRVSFRTPLQHCVKCQSTLASADVMAARLYTLRGVQEVEHIPMRCTSKSCRIRHLYNYRKQGGKKLNTMQHDQMDVIFVNSNTAFAKEFLEYHDALQFRGCVSNNAIAWAQQEVLWQDENEHASWNQAYSIASLYYYMIREAEKMWARSTNAKDKLAAIDLDNPLTDAFMADYTTRWHKHQLTRTEHMSIREIVLDGHEK
ncbi:unnamed protein product, partial [Symbiodinium sp. CCMP2592]